MKEIPDYEAIFKAESDSVNFLCDEAKALRVRWDKGMNYFLSFFAELDRLRPQIPEEKLNNWCIWRVGIGVPTIRKVATILQEEDARRIRQATKLAEDVANARARTERERAAAERQESEAAMARLRETIKVELMEEITKKLKETEEMTHDLVRRATSQITSELVADYKEAVLAGNEVVLAEFHKWMMSKHSVGEKTCDYALERARGEIVGENRVKAQLGEKPTIPTRTKRTYSSRAPRIPTTDVLDKIKTKVNPEPETPYVPTTVTTTDTAGIQALSDIELANRFRDAVAHANRENLVAITARQRWINATMALAEILAEIRKRYPADLTFGKWRKANGLGEDVIKHDNLAALNGFAANLTAARTALETTNSTSWNLIWRGMRDLSRNVSSEISVNNSEEIAEPTMSQAIH